jgi:dolichyl-phosphate-mannose-protein mannosyltransferase
MSRQLFLHHYFPALYFALLQTSVTFDLLTGYLRPKIRLQFVLILIGGAVISWYILSPLAYAGVWTRGQCENAKKLGKNWDFSCADFHLKVRLRSLPTFESILRRSGFSGELIKVECSISRS